ncbi:MAG: chromosome segregation protein SMC [Desulfobacterales bacterium]|jgi:chromosome segregation protein
MKLKKLELLGFKSFVDRVSIPFPPGVSAIVGPNGCGKSNVVDALRWVMGEQSVKQLRGKAMEDVIFAGADGRPPLNMAEVSVTLLNDNGSAPEEFREYSEIQVTRRLFRSGESAYLINRQPCRLKDIHNLFMGTGMGAKTYAVIQQGNIGAITDAGPEERRLFIEEAAGITRYKTRKNEALRKVEATRQNLLRVSDIISEVQRQMNGLKRQAKKAERFKQFQDRIRRLDILLNLSHYSGLSAEVEKTEQLLQNLQDTDIEHTSQLKQLDAAVEEIKLKRWQKDQEIADQKNRKYEAQRRLDRMENDSSHLREEVKRLESEIGELDAARVDLEEKEAGISAEMEQVRAENTSLQTRISEVNSELAGERTKSGALRERLDGLNESLESAKSEMMELVAEEARYRNIYQNAASNKESLQRRLKKTDEEEALAGRRIQEARTKEAAAGRQLEDIRQQIEKCKIEVKQAQEQLDEHSRALGEQVKTAQTLELERKTCRSRHAALKKMEDNFEWFKSGVRAIMKPADGGSPDAAADRKRFEGDVIGLMADVIEPEDGYETAVEAVLGEALQYILVRNQDSGVAAIDYLQRSGAGRGGFVPVAGLKELERGSRSKPDGERLLMRHITVKPGFEGIVGALIGHVTVAENLPEAIALWNRNGTLQTVVSKGGDIVDHQGVLIGGSPENLSGILAKKQEIKSLERELSTLDERIDSAQEKQIRMEKEVRRLEADLQQRIEEKTVSVENEIEAEKHLYKATEDRKQAERHLEIVRLEQEQLLGEESDIDDQMAEYDRVLKEIENRVETAQAAVSERSLEIRRVSEEMETFNQRAVDFKVKLTSLEASLENSDNTLRRLKEFFDDGKLRLEQLNRDLAIKKQRMTESGRRIEDNKSTLSRLYEEMKELESQIETNEADYRQIDERLQQIDGQVSDIRNLREETLQKIRLLEVELSQYRVKQENIVQRLSERYERSLADLRREFADSDEARQSAEEGGRQGLEEKLAGYRKKIERIGDVNLGAIKEYEDLKTRFDFLNEQREDLFAAMEDLQKVIRKINRITRERFMTTFELVNEKLQEIFPQLFEGGSAKLVLTEPNNPLETGVEYLIHPPGKKLTRMSLLSGGEKAMAAIAFVFSIFMIRPTSFCLMDEIDAPLDEANVFRFNDLLKVIGEKSQIIMVTHNKRSMEFADTLFGITMEKKGVSKVVSVDLSRGDERNIAARN